MKVVKFEALRIEGFSSIVLDTQIELSGAGITMVKGENGVGKTTMFSALSWCLYAVNLKGVNADKVQSWTHIRTESYRGTRVAVKVKDGAGKVYMIARHLNFTGVTFEHKQKSGVSIFEHVDSGWQLIPEHPQHIKDCNDWIEDLMGMNSQLFLNSVLFGQRMKRLVESSGDEKRALFEGIFNLDFIARVKKNADAKAQELNAEIVKLVSTDAMATSKLRFIMEQLVKLDEAKVKFDLNQTERLCVALTRLEFKTQAFIQAKASNEDIVEYAKHAQEQEKEKQSIIVKKEGFQKDLSAQKLSVLDCLAKFELKEETLRKAQEVYSQQATTKQEERNALQNSRLDLIQMQSGFTRDIDKYAQSINDQNFEKAALERGLAEIKTTCTVCDSPIKPEKLKAAKANISKQIKDIDILIKVLSDKLPMVIEQRDSIDVDIKQADENLSAVIVTIDQLKETLVEGSRFIANILIYTNPDFKGVPSDDWVELTDELRALRSGQNAIVEAIKSTDSWLLDYEDVSDVLEKVALSVEVLQAAEYAVKEVEANVLHIKQEKPVEVDKAPLQADIVALETQIDLIHTEHCLKVDELEKVTFWQKACGASGIKAYVFSAMFSLLNDAVVKYASRLGIMVTFGVDNTKASKPFTTQCYMNGAQVDYEELSGGQKQRVDIALAFATHDVVSVNTNVSLLIMDEVFEGLDSSGIETAFDLIRVKAGDAKKVFVISHANEIDGLGTKSITLKLNKWGFTEIDN